MKTKLMMALCFTLLISGCSIKKELIPTGGSKSDGTVRMGYSFGLFESPVIDPKQGMVAAKARCAAWGYSGAEPFGGFTSQCTQPSSSGCMQTTVTVEYQCTGEIKK
ncbi:YecR family lipoprotein [Lonsdalea quercina]|uniref:YecR family lipoprotein n=1 Tax=Lonsdalea quercina TaxID=71657 RepID=UPI003976EEEA